MDHSNIPANHAELNAPDISTRETGTIMVYFVIFSTIFFATFYVLYMYFRWELNGMQEERVRAPVNAQYEEIKSKASAQLEGAKLNIREAMKKTVAETKK